MTDPGAPRLSVLLPTWNAAATVERALASILDEVDVRLECLVIDDASTDGTADLVASVAERDPRVVLIRLPANGGVSNARNRGLEVARGTWLAFLDADDVILPDGLAAIMRPTEDPTVRAVIGQRIQFDGDRRWVSRRYDQPDIREPGRKSIASNPGLMSYAAIHGKAFHRSLTEGLRFEGRVLGDQPWTIQALLRAGGDIEVIGDVVYEWWRPRPGRAVGITGATRASTERAAEMVLRAPVVYTAVSDEVERRIAEPATRRRIRRAYFERLVRSDLGVAVDRRPEAPSSGDACIAGRGRRIPRGGPGRGSSRLGPGDRPVADAARRPLAGADPPGPPELLADRPIRPARGHATDPADRARPGRGPGIRRRAAVRRSHGGCPRVGDDVDGLVRPARRSAGPARGESGLLDRQWPARR